MVTCASERDAKSASPQEQTPFCPYLLRQAKDGVLGTPLGQDIPDQVLLAIVGGEDGYLVRRVALETQVHEYGYSVLCLGQVLKGVKEGGGGDSSQ